MVRQSLGCCALVVSWLLTLHPIAAQSLSDAEKIERLERQAELLQKQTDQMQRQIKALQAEIIRARNKDPRTETGGAKRSESPAGRGEITAVTSAVEGTERPELKRLQDEIHWIPERLGEETRRISSSAKDELQSAGVKVTLGGFFTADSVYRTRNQVNDMATVFGGIPYPFSPLYNEHEFHGSARASEISVLAEGNIDAAQKLAGYFEWDFLGVGNTSNYIETNDWAPRLRQGHLTYDNNDWGFHLLAGQAWSLVTQYKAGLTPGEENIPLTINQNYVVGWDFARQWQIRAVKEFDKTLWLGISVENSQTLDAPNIPKSVNGLVINTINTGTGGFLNGVEVTPDYLPDIIEKVALDPGWGHYEVFGLQRFFTDNTFCATAVPTGCAVGKTRLKTTFGAGVGGSVLLPVIPKYLDVEGGGTYGRGIGRYGPALLPDVTIAADGSLAPITEFHAWVGIVGYPWEDFEVFAYGGIEQVQANFFDALGYGNPVFDNRGCTITTAASFATNTSSACVANTRRITDIKAGFWQNLYKGRYGRFVAGVEAEYLKNEAFAGIGGAPRTDNIIVLTSFRYYPF